MATPMPDREAYNEVDDSAQSIPEAPRHEDIARRAYELWEARGCPHGCADEDWYRAEQELSGEELPEDSDSIQS
jgi:hypothetical protein